MYKIMTPGPTQVRENVRAARSLVCTNPDLDPEFYDYYKETCELVSQLLHTENETLILGGEGILGLEAACASLTESGDSVLVIDNGVYGKGFADFVSMYGGNVTFYSAPYTKAIDMDEFSSFLSKRHDFKYATMVHCDTPSGVLNPVEEMSRELHKYGILTVVDSVSAMFGEPLDVTEGQLDIVCGGSQKALSAPPGLAFVTISQEAKRTMERRKTPIASFYANLMIFKDYYEKQWFPYTMPISDICGLRTALENVSEDENRYERHAKMGEMTRKAVLDMGLSLYLEDGYSNTVTVVKVPDGIAASEILEAMKKEHHIMIAGSFDVLAGQVIRIGHMGENANEQDVKETLTALHEVLKKHGKR